MSFREALGRHLLAIDKRDLAALADTVAEFLDMHRAWFVMANWTLQAKPVASFETPQLGVAVMHLEYREPPSVHAESYLTLVFENRAGRWLMVQDQNTPIRK